MDVDVSNASYISQLAELLGGTEQALKLLFSLFLGYPLLHIHHLYFRKSNPNVQHIYFICCGLLLGIYNYNIAVSHSIVCIIAAWLNLYLIGGTYISVVTSFLFQMGYLIAGYYFTGTDTYDIKWTMPHCVLTLRLIALTFDYLDGQTPMDKLSKDQQVSALKKRPKLIEIAAQTYFPASFLVGPQFSMRRYLDFIQGTLYPANTPSPIRAGLIRGLAGVMYLTVYQIGSMWLPTNYLISDDFQSHSFIWKLILVGIWGKILLYKYLSCWLITEGACIMCGLAYSGKDEDGNAKWKGCANIKLWRFETAIKFEQIVAGFNTNTNNWVVQYVYKRLKFLNNKYVSQFSALMFLAIWHGLHSGYYATFFWEFLLMNFEKGWSTEVRKYPKIMSAMEKKPFYYLVVVVMKIYATIFMGYSLVPFALLKIKWWWGVYCSLYFCAHIVFGSWNVYAPLVKKGLRKVNAVFFETNETEKKDN